MIEPCEHDWAYTSHKRDLVTCAIWYRCTKCGTLKAETEKGGTR